ncbi:MAG TPA: FRG domain-containing protein [Bacteroidales bacterium]|jgi:hypothetical protein|nr:FRG domain-containing protein [Bacteroidales bacterium]
MRFYKTLQEKSQYFAKRNIRVDSINDLLAILKEFDNPYNSEVLFRGQPEARFMLYSSLQRIWIDRKLEKHYSSYGELIYNLIDNSRKWNSGLITRYLRNAGLYESEMSILSIMQHYGVPTPLLDFTYDIKKSLFFAVNNIDLSPPGIDIERYFSIYYFFKNNELLADLPPGKREDTDFGSVMKSDLSLVDNVDEAFRIQNNLNILNQEGAFIFNSSPKEPLEKQFFTAISKKKRVSGKEFDSEIGGCINISKALAIFILDFLREKKIDNYSMFPDLNQLSRDCLNAEWQKLYAKNDGKAER